MHTPAGTKGRVRIIQFSELTRVKLRRRYCTTDGEQELMTSAIGEAAQEKKKGVVRLPFIGCNFCAASLIYVMKYATMLTCIAK